MKAARGVESSMRGIGGVGSWMMAAVLALWAGAAGAAPTRPPDAKVTFTLSSGGGAKVVGSTTELTLDTDGAWLVFRVPLATATTGEGWRDRQVRDKYLEVESYPAVELRVEREAVKVPTRDANVTGDIPGKLTLHGKTRETALRYGIKKEGGALKVSGTLRIDLRAFGIDIPTLRGVTMKPDVDVEVTFGVPDGAVVASVRQ